MEIKIDCSCGTRFGFDVEPENGRMPTSVACPNCGCDGTSAANAQIQSRLGNTGVVRPMRINLGTHTAAAAPVITPPPPVAAPAVAMARATHSAPPDAPPDAPPVVKTPAGLLDRTQYFIKERVGLLKLVDTYDILDPISRETIGLAREEPPAWAKFLRLVLSTQMLPTSIHVYESGGAAPVISMSRGFTFFRARVAVTSGGRLLGYFRTKWFSLRGGFYVLDGRDQAVAQLKGNWVGWEFKFLNNAGREIGTVTKKWAGLGRELFTSADNYMINISDPGAAGGDTSALLLAAGLAVDTLFKEKGGGAGLSGLLGGD